jgi:phosphohistidine phosphatase
MELVLWRHAEAEDGEPDLQRALTNKGEKQARRVAEWLQAHLPDSAKLMVSPALRAQQTARALAEISGRRIRTVEALAPGAGAQQVLDALDWPDGRATLVVVGHQPTLGQVASRVLSGQDQLWSIKKGGAWWISSRQRDDYDDVVLRAVVNPDLI